MTNKNNEKNTRSNETQNEREIYFDKHILTLNSLKKNYKNGAETSILQEAGKKGINPLV